MEKEERADQLNKWAGQLLAQTGELPIISSIDETDERRRQLLDELMFALEDKSEDLVALSDAYLAEAERLYSGSDIENKDFASLIEKRFAWHKDSARQLSLSDHPLARPAAEEHAVEAAAIVERIGKRSGG